VERESGPMDWRINCLYRDYFYGYRFRQSWLQRFIGRLIGKYAITVSTWGEKGSRRTLILTQDYQESFNIEYLRRRGLRADIKMWREHEK